MAVTIRDIVGVPGLALRLLAGEAGLERPIRWVHSTELEDPTPWLKGGELLLTTGMSLVGATPARQRSYLRRLMESGTVGLGFGLGLSHEKVPKVLVTTARESGFPLFEVPYPVPFIAITEAVFSRLAAEQFEALHSAVEYEQILTRAVTDGRGVDGIAESLANVIGGWALLLDLHGMPLAATSRNARLRAERVWDELRRSRPEGIGFSLTIVDRGHHVWIQPVGVQGRVEAFLAVGKPESLGQTDRIVAGHALSLFAIELAKAKAVADAERKLQGDFFEELARGRLSAAEATRGLHRFGFAKGSYVVAVALEGGDPFQLAHAAEDHFSREGGGFLVSQHTSGVSVLLPASGERDLGELCKVLGSRTGAEIRAGSGSEVGSDEVGRSIRESRYALQVCRLEGWASAGFEDLGTYRLLLSMSEPHALAAFADSLLSSLDAYDRAHGGELVASLQAFLQHNARWETAAAHLYVHRHTLRYRMRKVEELTGRDLSSSFDRMEFWLALRVRELLASQSDS